MRRLDRLWNELGGPSLPPCADRRAVKSRVDAVLDADPTERRNHMKRKVTYALAATALAVAVTGSALAVGANLDAIRAFFGGDPAPVADYLDNTARSVRDENYVFSVDSSVSAGDETYLILTVKALNEETREFLFSDQFDDIDTFSIHLIGEETDTADGSGDAAGALALSWGDYAATQDSISLQANVSGTGNAEALEIRLGWMEKGKSIQVPLSRAASLTVEIGGSGTGIPDNDTLEAGTLTIDRVTLTPLTCEIDVSGLARLDGQTTNPFILFRMADGSVRTQSQMMTFSSSLCVDFENDRYELSYQFKNVQDLDQIAAIIAFDVEYPLDGSQPSAVAHDAALDPITVTRMDKLEEEGGFTLPVRELMDKLGGACVWDAETGAVTCTYRGVSIVLRAGETTALVDGEAVELSGAPGVVDGKLCADDAITLLDAWGLDGFVQHTTEFYEDADGNTVCDLTWLDWYIIP